ncbi:methyltransferase [Haloechinothrix halophila]|uniref:methyltransferase n=1 Tax=Haloechinothrix halophila TaxID=1069073 RepID=UPI0004130B4E|nr:methyltransferase [Haloechinothrix halophila]
MTTRPTPRITTDIGRLPAVLRKSGYKEADLRDLLAVPDSSAWPPVGHAPSAARISANAPGSLRSLAQLLLLGQPTDIDGSFPEELVSLLVDASLATQSTDRLSPLVRLTPFDDLFLASDLHNEDSQHVTSDVVESPHGPTHVLARAIPRTAVSRSLDIGTGAGAHALQLAAHSDTALGVDVSPRAVTFAEFNAALNGVTNVEFTVADVTSGLDEEKPFDLIVSNPPYLVSPETSVLYRDGPPGSDHVGTRVLAEAPRLLATGGLLVCLTSWAVSDPTDPAREPRAIAHRARCDGLALIYARRTPLDNAVRWNAHYADEAALERTVRTWLDFYRRHDVRELAYGIVVLTPAYAPQAVFRSERVSLAGQQLDRGQLRDLMRALDADRHGQPAAEDLRLHSDHEIASISAVREHGVVTREQVLRSTRGIQFEVEVGPRLLDLVANQVPPPSSAVGAEVLTTMAKRLYELGLLVRRTETDD